LPTASRRTRVAIDWGHQMALSVPGVMVFPLKKAIKPERGIRRQSPPTCPMPPLLLPLPRDQMNGLISW